MVETTGVSGSSPGVAGTNSANAVTAGQIAEANNGGAAGDTYTSETRISSLNDLRTKAPKLWDAMLMGIAQSICQKMQDANARLKKIMRESTSGR